MYCTIASKSVDVLFDRTFESKVVAFTADQWTRLNTIFKEGVCDWSKPGVEQQGLRGTWLKF
jgi:hypothetical protein